MFEMCVHMRRERIHTHWLPFGTNAGFMTSGMRNLYNAEAETVVRPLQNLGKASGSGHFLLPGSDTLMAAVETCFPRF